MSKVRRLIQLTCYIVICAFCIYIIQSRCFTSDLNSDFTRKQPIAYLQPISTFILDKQLRINDGIINAYRADFLITYNVDGVQYNRWVSGSGDLSYDWDRVTQEAILGEYQIGHTYQSWYDPRHPQFVVFVLHHDWWTILILMIVGIVGLVSFCNGLSIFLSPK